MDSYMPACPGTLLLSSKTYTEQIGNKINKKLKVKLLNSIK